MRLPGGLLILIFLTACSTPRSNENQSAVDKADTTASTLLPGTPGDTLSYIGYIQKFEDNQSFYTDLYFADGFNHDLYNDIIKMGDKVIFKDEETKRTRIEIKEAGQYFNLAGLQTITIYNRDNLALTTGRLSHIEYVEDLIDNKFVAVFDVRNPDISDYLFCIGNMSVDLPTIKVLSYDDKKLDADLITYLKLSADHVWGITYYQLDDQTTYATVSADTTAFIVESTGKTYQTLYKSKFSELISQLTIISKKINGRQILLTISGMPETDMAWTSVLTFNGTEYETSKDHRVKF